MNNRQINKKDEDNQVYVELPSSSPSGTWGIEFPTLSSVFRVLFLLLKFSLLSFRRFHIFLWYNKIQFIV